MKVVALVQARLASTRLPRKALREISSRPLIGHLIDRLRQMRGLDEIALAIGDASGNEPLVAFAKAESLPWFVGSETDVLGRFIGAAEAFKADAILRATPDCPLWAPDLGGQVLAAFRQGFDYVHNTRPGVDGFDTEVFTLAALQMAGRQGTGREHVTSWMRSTLRVIHVQQAPELWHLKLSVDTQEDFDRVSAIFAHLPLDQRYEWSNTLFAARAAGLA